MRIIRIKVYEMTPKNFRKDGTLSRRSEQCRGSFLATLDDHEAMPWKTADLLSLGYRNIRSGYVDNVLYFEDGDGKEYCAFAEMTSEMFPEGMAIGFSGFMK